MGLIFDGTTGVSTTGNVVGNNIIATGTFSPSALNVTGNISAGGNVTATAFYGDGGHLSNISSGGNLSVSQWTTGNVLSNTIATVSNIWFDNTTGFSVTSLTGNTALISLGSSFKTWEVAGQSSLVAVGEDTVEFIAGNNIVITTDAGANPQSIAFAVDPNIAATSVSVTGNIQGSYILGNGAYLTGLPAGYANANVANYLANGNDPTIVAIDGNVSNVYTSLTGIASTLSNTNSNVSTLQSNVISLTGVIYANANVATYLSSGTVSTNIGTTANITATGNVYGANVVASYLHGDGSNLTGVISNYGNSNVQAYLPTYTGTLANITIQTALVNYQDENGTPVNFGAGNTIINNNPGGANTEIQFKDAVGNFGASAALTFDSASNVLAVGGVISSTGNIVVGSGSYFIGDGSQLTGITTSTGNILFNSGLLYTNSPSIDLWLSPSGPGANVTGNAYIDIPSTTTGGAGSALLIYNEHQKGIQNPAVVIGGGSGNAATVYGNGYFATPGLMTNNYLYANGAPLSFSSNAITCGNSSVSVCQSTGIAFNLPVCGAQTPAGGIKTTGAVAIGVYAGQSSQGSGAVAVGTNAGYSAQGCGAVAIGSAAAIEAQGVNAVAIGGNAGQYSQGSITVAIGQNAGHQNQAAGANAIYQGGVAIGLAAGFQSQGPAAVAIGTCTGKTTQQYAAVAIGQNAGKTCQGPLAVAIGTCTGQISQGSLAVAIGTAAGATNQGGSAIAVGRCAGGCNQGTEAIAIGRNAGLQYQGANAIAIGAGAGQCTQSACSIIINATGSYLNAANPGLYVRPIRNNAGACGAGYTCAQSLGYDVTTGEIVYGVSGVANAIATGYNKVLTSGCGISFTLCNAGPAPAGQITGSMSGSKLAIGISAGQTCQGMNAIAIGSCAGALSQATKAIAIGQNAGKGNCSPQSEASIAIGYGSAQNGQGANAIAIGTYAGAGCGVQSTNQSDNAVAIGYQAGQCAQGACAIGIGYQAGQLSQTFAAVAIGYQAGQLSQGALAIALGYQAGKSAQSDCAIAIGRSAGFISQSAFGVAVGVGAGGACQGGSAVAIGQSAGNQTQGSTAVAVGYYAGCNNQGISGVAIGYQAGQWYQSNNAIAIGRCAGSGGLAGGTLICGAQQNTNAIAIGYGAGQRSQGGNAIAIGAAAGQCNQAACSIVINALGFCSTLTSGNAGFYVQPVRSAVGTCAASVYYCTSIKEITYGPKAGPVSQTISTADTIGFTPITVTANAATAIDATLTAYGTVSLGYAAQKMLILTNGNGNVTATTYAVLGSDYGNITLGITGTFITLTISGGPSPGDDPVIWTLSYTKV